MNGDGSTCHIIHTNRGSSRKTYAKEALTFIFFKKMIMLTLFYFCFGSSESFFNDERFAATDGISGDHSEVVG